MPHNRFVFDMPAESAVVFDAFHYHFWRLRWDSLVSETQVLDGAPCPSVGAVTHNEGGGWLRTLSMRTRFVSYQPPSLAAATMQGHSFPFARWAASMRHRDVQGGGSVLLYTYSFETVGGPLRLVLAPVTRAVFERQTRRRFTRLRRFLQVQADAVRDWQRAGRPIPVEEP